MKFWGCLVLCALVACGSKSGNGGAAGSGSGPGSGSGSGSAAPAPSKPFAVAFVVQGSEMWVGNDDVEPPEGDPVMGALKPFKEAFAHMSFKDLPAGSKAMVISYGEHATVRRPMGPIDTLKPADFGDQKDARTIIDRNLVEGVSLGIDELAKVNDARRMLVIIGDGTDENFDKAKENFAKLASKAGSANVEIVSLVYQGQFSPSYTMISPLDPNFVRVNTADAIVDQLKFALIRLVQPIAAASNTPVPLLLAVVMSGSEVWLGNDDFTQKDAPDYFPGALHAIRAALDRAPLKGFPEGAMATLITYDSGVRTKGALMPIETFDANAIGVQKDYKGRVGSDLVTGVKRALTQMAQLPGARRVIIVLGDGNDTNNDAAKTQLAELAKDAAKLNTEVHAIVYKGPLSEKSTVVTELDPKATTVATADELTTALVTLLNSLRPH